MNYMKHVCACAERKGGQKGEIKLPGNSRTGHQWRWRGLITCPHDRCMWQPATVIWHWVIYTLSGSVSHKHQGTHFVLHACLSSKEFKSLGIVSRLLQSLLQQTDNILCLSHGSVRSFFITSQFQKFWQNLALKTSNLLSLLPYNKCK